MTNQSIRAFRKVSFTFFFGIVCIASSAFAQFRVEVSGVGVTQIPIAFSSFRNESSSPQKITSIVRNDLERSGLFKPQLLKQVVDENQRPDLSEIRNKGADAFVSGSISALSNGQYEVRFRLWDAVKEEDLGARSYVVYTQDLRIAAHRISDFIYEKLTSEKAIFSTRIAFVTKLGGKYNLWISDIDGENSQSALSSPEPIISPSWSPDGKYIAYVSFESRKPVVYIHKVSDGTRHAVADFKGSNSAPTWTPDGRSLVLALSKDGSQQLYVIDVSGGVPKRIFQSLGIDTEPVFTSDGKTLYFVSDRSGGPQIYRVAYPNGTPERVTFATPYSISPTISPDGQLLAYVSKVGASYKLQLMNLATQATTVLTDTVADERPSFAPNGRMIVYATQQSGKDALMTTTLDGKVKVKLAGQLGDMREPNWGPFLYKSN